MKSSACLDQKPYISHNNNYKISNLNEPHTFPNSIHLNSKQPLLFTKSPKLTIERDFQNQENNFFYANIHPQNYLHYLNNRTNINLNHTRSQTSLLQPSPYEQQVSSNYTKTIQTINSPNNTNNIHEPREEKSQSMLNTNNKEQLQGIDHHSQCASSEFRQQNIITNISNENQNLSDLVQNQSPISNSCQRRKLCQNQIQNLQQQRKNSQTSNNSNDLFKHTGDHCYENFNICQGQFGDQFNSPQMASPTTPFFDKINNFKKYLSPQTKYQNQQENLQNQLHSYNNIKNDIQNFQKQNILERNSSIQDENKNSIQDVCENSITADFHVQSLSDSEKKENYFNSSLEKKNYACNEEMELKNRNRLISFQNSSSSNAVFKERSVTKQTITINSSKINSLTNLMKNNNSNNNLSNISQFINSKENINKNTLGKIPHNTQVQVNQNENNKNSQIEFIQSTVGNFRSPNQELYQLIGIEQQQQEQFKEKENNKFDVHPFGVSQNFKSPKLSVIHDNKSNLISKEKFSLNQKKEKNNFQNFIFNIYTCSHQELQAQYINLKENYNELQNFQEKQISLLENENQQLKINTINLNIQLDQQIKMLVELDDKYLQRENVLKMLSEESQFSSNISIQDDNENCYQKNYFSKFENNQIYNNEDNNNNQENPQIISHTSQILNLKFVISEYKQKLSQLTMQKEVLFEKLSKMMDLSDNQQNYTVQKIINSVQNNATQIQTQDTKSSDENNVKHEDTIHTGCSQDYQDTRNYTFTINNCQENECPKGEEILYEIKKNLNLKQDTQIVGQLKNNINADQVDSRFVKSMSDLTLKCAPSGYFQDTPNQKQIWKFIKKMMEEYMNIKGRIKEEGEHLKLCQVICKYLEIEDQKQIIPKIYLLQEDNKQFANMINLVQSHHNKNHIQDINQVKIWIEKLYTKDRLIDKIEKENYKFGGEEEEDDDDEVEGEQII